MIYSPKLVIVGLAFFLATLYNAFGVMYNMAEFARKRNEITLLSKRTWSRKEVAEQWKRVINGTIRQRS